MNFLNTVLESFLKWSIVIILCRDVLLSWIVSLLLCMVLNTKHQNRTLIQCNVSHSNALLFFFVSSNWLSKCLSICMHMYIRSKIGNVDTATSNVLWKLNYTTTTKIERTKKERKNYFIRPLRINIA